MSLTHKLMHMDFYIFFYFKYTCFIHTFNIIFSKCKYKTKG